MRAATRPKHWTQGQITMSMDEFITAGWQRMKGKIRDTWGYYVLSFYFSLLKDQNSKSVSVLFSLKINSLSRLDTK
jgi:hypothetical protein